MNRMPEDRREARLELARRLGVERAVGNAELLSQRQFALERAKTAVAAVELAASLLAEITQRARFREQRFMLRHRAREQRTNQARGFHQARGGRCGTKLQQPRSHVRQKGQVIIGLRRAFERDPQQGQGSDGKAGGKIVLPSIAPALP
jgi:hypothetical protein